MNDKRIAGGNSGMQRDQVKWLVVGLVGSLVALLAFIGAIFLVVLSLRERLNSRETTDYREDGTVAWKREAEKYKREKAESAETQAILDARYTTVSIFGDLYETLFVKKDFAAVEQALAEKYALIDDMHGAYQYSKIVGYLGRLQYEYDPEELRRVVEQWTDESPDSHFAWLIRGEFEIEYAWYWRGDEHIDSVTDKGRDNYIASMDSAGKSIARAIELDPNDPAALALHLQVATDSMLGKEEVDRRFNRAVSVAPAVYDAYYLKLWDLTPVWGGSWEQMDAFADKCDKLAAELQCPYLLQVRFVAYDEMRTERPGYEDIYERPDVLAAWLDMNRKIMEAWPDDLDARSNYANALYGQQKFAEAHEQFELIGDRYADSTRWPSLDRYNACRAYTMFKYANDAFTDHEQRMQFFLRALAMDDRLGAVWHALAKQHLQASDPKSAEAAFRSGIEKNPKHQDCWVGLAGFLAEAERYEELAKLMRESKRYPDFSSEARAELRKFGKIAEEKQKSTAPLN